MKLAIFFIATVGVVAVSGARDSPIDWFDCAVRAEGNYAHPIDCTRFLTCSNGIGYEMDCAICAFDPVRCPQGRLVFDRRSNMCLYADEAECKSLCDPSGEEEDTGEGEIGIFKAGKPLAGHHRIRHIRSKF